MAVGARVPAMVDPHWLTATGTVAVDRLRDLFNFIAHICSLLSSPKLSLICIKVNEKRSAAANFLGVADLLFICLKVES